MKPRQKDNLGSLLGQLEGSMTAQKDSFRFLRTRLGIESSSNGTEVGFSSAGSTQRAARHIDDSVRDQVSLSRKIQQTANGQLEKSK